MKRAFTLIELLVVIAIIAILAAILFPVFAQAKVAAKKTQDLNNLKQMNMAVQMYLADNEDIYPLTIPGNLGTTLFTMPVDRTATSNPGYRQAFYGNSLYPYAKSWALYNGPAANAYWEPFGTQTPTPVVDFAYTLNSYLNSWSASSSPLPASTVTYWAGLADHKVAGYGFSYPLIYPWQDGSQTATWHFQNSGDSCVSNIGFFTGAGDTWKYNAWGNGANMTYGDGHAKFQKFGGAEYPYILNTDGTFKTWWVESDTCYYAATLSPLREW